MPPTAQHRSGQFRGRFGKKESGQEQRWVTVQRKIDGQGVPGQIS